MLSKCWLKGALSGALFLKTMKNALNTKNLFFLRIFSLLSSLFVPEGKQFDWKDQVKGTLMQIWKSPYMFVFKFSCYLPVKFVSFLKSRLIFNLFCCCCMFVTSFSHVSGAHFSKSKRCFNVNSSTYFFILKQRYWQIFESALVYL